MLEGTHMGVEPKIEVVFTPPNHPFVHRVFHEINHPFWGTSIFGNNHIFSCLDAKVYRCLHGYAAFLI